MKKTLTILLVIAVAYAATVSKLYSRKDKQAAKFYKFWTNECASVMDQHKKIKKNEEAIGQLNSCLAAKNKEIEKLSIELEASKNIAHAWRERGRRFKMNAEEYKKKYFLLLARLS